MVLNGNLLRIGIAVATLGASAVIGFFGGRVSQDTQVEVTVNVKDGILIVSGLDLCLDPDAQVSRVEGRIPRYEVDLAATAPLLDDEGAPTGATARVNYDLTVADGSDHVAIETERVGAPVDYRSEPMTEELRACLAERAVLRQ